MTDTSPVSIAIVGMAALMPGSPDVSTFWHNIVQGRDLITDVPATHWLIDDYYDPDPAAPDKTYCKRGAFVPEVQFDPIAYGLPPNQIEATDRAQILGMMVAEALLADVQGNLSGPVDRDRTGVILGSGGLSLMGIMNARLQRPIWLTALVDSGITEPEAEQICERISAGFVPWQEASFPGLLSNVIAGRIANRLDLHGINCTVDAACAGSLAAVSASISELVLGRADLMLTGGVDALNAPFMFICFSKTPALSPTGDCRPFSADADGTLLGEGLGMVALKRLADAERDCDRIYAVITGIGSSSDGRGNAIYAPSAQGQALALRRAYESAGYSPDTVELVEAHGTGTKAGDGAEFGSLQAVFGETGRTDRNWCALGSIKSQIGHTKAAAGSASMIKTTLALRNQILPPTIKADRPNPALAIGDSPFYLNTRTRPWIRNADHPRRASVSSFGFGGSNFHLTMEEYRPGNGGRAALRQRVVPSELFLVDGADAARLAARGRALLTRGTAAQIARASQGQFDCSAPLRLAVVGSDPVDLAARFERAVSAIAEHPQESFALSGVSFEAEPATDGAVGFVFPGQGSQYVNMGADISVAFECARSVWDEAAAIDWGESGLHGVVFPVPTSDPELARAQEEVLTDTRWAQPALAAHSLALLAILTRLGVRPQCLAGHSLGELVALCAGGAISPADLLRLSRARGQLIATATQVPGAMLAVTADQARAAALIQQSGSGDAWVANINQPRQTVISGTREAITEIETLAAESGLTSRRLPVHTGFHSPMVASAATPLLSFLQTLPIQAPHTTVYSNIDAARYPCDADAIRHRLASQLTAPVDFVAETETMYAAGVRVFVEVGAGSSVTGMVDAILGDRPHRAVNLDHKDRQGVTALFTGLGRLAVAGVPIDFAPLWEGYALDPDAQTRPVAAMTIPVTGSAFAHRYPPHDAPTGNRGSRQPHPPLTPMPVPEQGAATLMGSQQLSPTPPSPYAVEDPQWLAAVAETQRCTAETHAAFQQALLASHQAYLQVAERTMSHLADLAAGSNAPTASSMPGPALVAAPHLSSVTTPIAEKVVAPDPTPPSPASLAPSVLPDVVSSPPTGPVQDIGGPDAGSTGETATVTTDLLLEILADKTGYPLELLSADMDLESELGVDSIKKVEILAAVRHRVPDMPTANSPEMADVFKLRTLNAVATAINAPDVTTAVPAPPANAADADDTAEGAGSALRRLKVRHVPIVAPGMAMTGLVDAAIQVVDGGSGLAQAIVDTLTRHGLTAAVAGMYPRAANAVLLLGGLREDAGPDQARTCLREAFRWARAVAPTMEHDGGVFVTAQDTGGDFGVSCTDPSRAWFGGLAALTRTAAQEWPAAAVKALDIARNGRDQVNLAELIVTELLTGGPAVDVGFTAEGTRGVPELTEVPEDLPATPVVDDSSVVVVSGGARGVTAAALCHLTRIAHPRLAILGRTPITDEPPELAGARDERALVAALAHSSATPAVPAQLADRARTILAVREVRESLAALRAAGADVRYFPVDITDRGGVESALRLVRSQWGPITAVIHAAGVLADKTIAEKTDDQYERVMATKVDGLRVLLDATAADPLALICVFSSVAATVGNPGQCDYAMANETLNHVVAAQRHTRPDCLVRSIAWGPWNGGMVDPGLAEHFAARSVPLIPVTVGAAAFTRELAGTSRAQHVIITAGTGPVWPSTRVFRATVDLASPLFAVLADHTIDGITVLPLAFAVEWFAALTSAWQPATGPVVLRDLAVLRKVDVTVDSPLTLEATRGETGLSVSLSSSHFTLHYRGLSATGPVPCPNSWPAPTGMHTLDRTDIYDGQLLFHGPRFQVLRGPVELGDQGALAEVLGVGKLDWPGEQHWFTDPAAVDGALQLAMLWAQCVSASSTLPMAVREVRVHRQGPAESTLQCRLRACEVGDDVAICDAALIDATGQVYTELFGIQLVVRPRHDR
jgi:acyl transferase domain-containing protein/NADP-dependent 3-hydroxy acid dehydrogenase YdfG